MFKTTLIIGGTSGIGLEVARVALERGGRVLVTGRDTARAARVAAGLGGESRGVALDLARPTEIAGRLSDVGRIDRLVLAAVERDVNSLREYDASAALSAVALKVVGYAAAINALLGKLASDAAIVAIGGLARRYHCPGSTSVALINGAVTSMAKTFAAELAPIRVNAVHPGVVVDSPAQAAMPPAMLDRVRAQTPSKKPVTMRHVADAVTFLLENEGINGVNLDVDGGFPTHW